MWVCVYCTVSNTCTARPYPIDTQSSSVDCALSRCEQVSIIETPILRLNKPSNLAHYMPDITAYTTPLSGCARNNHPFIWMPLLDKCFESIKALASRAPILRPINPNNPKPIWVITDGSKSGVGAVYGQGNDWETCRPAGFLSKKFSDAQHHYKHTRA